MTEVVVTNFNKKAKNIYYNKDAKPQSQPAPTTIQINQEYGYNNEEMQKSYTRKTNDQSMIRSKNDTSFKTNNSPAKVIQRSKARSPAVQRCVLNRLGMQVDPVCHRRGHERGRIQYLCYEHNCEAPRRLACAHCMIEEHGDHVANKLLLENYCEKFELAYRDFAFQCSRMSETEENTYFPTLQKEIIDGISKLQSNIFDYLEGVKEKLITQVIEVAHNKCTQVRQFIETHQVLLEKESEFLTKNVFEMTQSELNITLKLLDREFLPTLQKDVTTQFQYVANQENESREQWKIYEKDLLTKIDHFINSGNNFILDECLVRPAIATFAYDEQIPTPSQLTKQPSQPSKIYQTTPKQLTQSSGTNTQTPFGKKVQNGQSPLHCQNVQVSKQNQKFNFKTEKSSPKNKQTCIHQPGLQCIPIFKCCQQAYPCALCHDQDNQHKAIMNIPSKRQCLECQEVFTVNHVNNFEVSCPKFCNS